jgi:hypothetical protein
MKRMNEVEEEEKDSTRLRGDHKPERRWQDIPRNAVLAEAEVLSFFSEFKGVAELTVNDIIDRCTFLVRHAPPRGYVELKIKGKFVSLVKALEKVCDF